MIPDLAPRFLTWDEVDPGRHPFDAASAERVVRSLGPAACVPHRPEVDRVGEAMSAWSWDEAKPWTDALSHALVERYGRWTLGWRWSRGEGDLDGGPIGNWCCTRDSITAPDETLDRVVAALCEWRTWLEDLSRWFEAHPLDLADIEDQRPLWEATARTLIRHVVDRTDCDSGWHAHCRLVLTWFLSSRHVAPDLAAELVEKAIGGRFHSWTAPDEVVIDEVAEVLAHSVRSDGAAKRASPTIDHLEHWLTLRETVPWHTVATPDVSAPGQAGPSRDGAVEDIRAFDGAIDPARAQGLLAALEQVRADAARATPLDFSLLRGWQLHVVGTAQPPPFRTRPAFAKGGRERYGIGPDTRERLDACLAESRPGPTARPLPVAARAARAYLDVCFFHPFDDGNARAAFLTLVYVLARENISLNDVGLLRRISFQADNPDDPLTLVRCIDIRLARGRSADTGTGGPH